jgi:DNA-binding response OmpR family regulator
MGFGRRGGEPVANGEALILLAEDDEAQREVLVEVLEVEGYRVIAASGPAEVLAGLGHSPALVLLDLVGVASPQVMSALRAVPMRPALVVMSGDASLAAVAERLGADGYLTKPYDLDELLARVREALQRAGRADGRARAPGAR